MTNAFVYYASGLRPPTSLGSGPRDARIRNLSDDMFRSFGFPPKKNQQPLHGHGSSLPPLKKKKETKMATHRTPILNAGASSGGDIQVFQALVQLKSLDLGNTQVVGDIQAFQATQSLDSLRLVATQVSGEGLAWWKKDGNCMKPKSQNNVEHE